MMRTKRLPVVAALLAAPAASAQPLSVPEAMIAAFAEICLPSEPPGFDDAVALAGENGWTDIEPEAHPELRTLMDRVEAGIDVAGPDARIALFQREAAYRNAVLVLTFVPADAGAIVGCCVYDFDATEAIPDNLMEALLGAEPTAQEDRPGAMAIQQWEAPAAFPAILEASSNFIPEDSPLIEATGFSGTALIARWTPP